jgi:hypothetical protein
MRLAAFGELLSIVKGAEEGVWWCDVAEASCIGLFCVFLLHQRKYPTRLIKTPFLNSTLF